MKYKKRNKRYINTIDIWEIQDNTYDYIKDLIIEYLSIKDDLTTKIKLMIFIDKELYKILQNHSII